MNNIGKVLLIVLLSIVSNASDLTNEELAKAYACENTDTGVAPYRFSIGKFVVGLRQGGIKATVSLSGSNLTINTGLGKETGTMELKSMDSGELKSKNILCYEPIKYTEKNYSVSKSDETLSPKSKILLYYFGGLLPTETDKKMEESRKAKDRIMKATLQKQKDDLAREERDRRAEEARKDREVKLRLEKEKRIADEEAEKKRQIEDAKVKRLENKEKREARKALRNKKKFAKNIWNNFLNKYDALNKLKQSSRTNGKTGEIVISDDFLDDFLDMCDKLEVAVPGISKYSDLKTLSTILERYYDYEDKERLSKQTYLNSRFENVNKKILYKIKKMK